MELFEKACREQLFAFGYLVLIAVRDCYEHDERYEHCAAINKVLHAWCPDVDLPRHVDPAAIEDYVCAFWRYGMSGETARSNFIHYAAVTKVRLDAVSQ